MAELGARVLRRLFRRPALACLAVLCVSECVGVSEWVSE